MRRYGYIVLSLAVVAWVVVAIVLGTGTLSGAHASVPPSGPSPACLPPVARTAARRCPGTTVDVSPAPETDTANPHTQISFLGMPVTDIRDVSVEGSRTGYHYGHVYGYYQGDGGSFVPNKPFDAGERVVVRAVVEAAGQRTPQSLQRSASPRPTPPTAIPSLPQPAAPPSSYQSFASAPDLHPPILQRHHARPRSRGR